MLIQSLNLNCFPIIKFVCPQSNGLCLFFTLGLSQLSLTWVKIKASLEWLLQVLQRSDHLSCLALNFVGDVLDKWNAEFSKFVLAATQYLIKMLGQLCDVPLQTLERPDSFEGLDFCLIVFENIQCFNHSVHCEQQFLHLLLELFLTL